MNRNRELCEMFHKLWCKGGNKYAYRQYKVYSERYQKECLARYQKEYLTN